MKRGTTIAELIVALVLASVVFGLVTQSVIAQRRSERTIAGASQGPSVADETIGVLTSVLDRVSSADTVHLRGDTAIDVDRTIGVAVACVAGGDSLVVRDDGMTSWWESPPDSGDAIDALIAGQWWGGEIVSARSRTAASGDCSGPQRVFRVRPSPAVTAELPVVRVARRTRFMVYRGGDGAWWFGERTCSGSPPYACSSAQPVSGPLISARALQFAIDTAGNVPVVTASATAGKTTRTVVRPLRP